MEQLAYLEHLQAQAETEQNEDASDAERDGDEEPDSSTVEESETDADADEGTGSGTGSASALGSNLSQMMAELMSQQQVLEQLRQGLGQAGKSELDREEERQTALAQRLRRDRESLGSVLARAQAQTREQPITAPQGRPSQVCEQPG